jgi:hypothetical protein
MGLTPCSENQVQNWYALLLVGRKQGDVLTFAFMKILRLEPAMYDEGGRD